MAGRRLHAGLVGQRGLELHLHTGAVWLGRFG